MANIIKVISVIVGTMIGAGFASGAEMYTFFFSYGKSGLIGIAISCLLSGLIIYKVLKVVNKYEIYSYKEFLDVLFCGGVSHKASYAGMSSFDFKKWIVKFVNIIVNVFILATFFIMVAGFGAYFEQEFGVDSLIGSALFALATFFTFMKDVRGAVKANEFLVPILVLLVIVIGVMILARESIFEMFCSVTRVNHNNYILSAIVYSSYNSILLVPVLITLKKFLKDKRQIFQITFISSFIIAILSVVIFLLLGASDIDLANVQMPVVSVVSSKFNFLKHLYGIVILGSIYTTAVSLGTSYLQNVTVEDGKGKGYFYHAVIICIASVLVSKLGFSYLVNLLYPIFGYLGLFQMYKLFKRK